MSAYMNGSNTGVTVTPMVLSPAELEGFGLSESDLAEVEQVARRIQSDNPASVSEFGRDVADHTSGYADTMLGQLHSSDLDEAGSKLAQVLNIARGLNAGSFVVERSRLPIIGPLIDKVRLKAAGVKSRFETAREQIDGLISEVEVTQDNLITQNAGLAETFGAVREEHRMLGVHIAAGKIRVAELTVAAAELRSGIGNSPAKIQEVADLDALISNLDKRVGDLVALQHSALQTLPVIRLIQANNQALVDKFHTVRQVTVPVWKRNYMVRISLNEQRDAVELAKTIDEATNALLRENSDLLRRNTIDAAKANQRLVIDVETLEYVNNNLIGTVEDALALQGEGGRLRKDAERKVMAMRSSLRYSLVGKDAPRKIEGGV